MYALKGYFDGEKFISLDKTTIKKNQKVIITILDEFIETTETNNRVYKKYIGKLDYKSFSEIEKALNDCERIDIDEW
jgi:hypothetical protein